MVLKVRAHAMQFLFVSVFALVCGASAAVPWLPFGPDGGDARKIASDPRDAAHLFLGTVNGWVYESRNAGGNWRRLTRVGNRDDLVLGGIVVDPKNSKHLIVGAWAVDRPDGGIFLSNDGGLTWQNQAEMRGQSIRSLAASASDSNILVAGSLEGVFRSKDGGQRWSRISPRDSTEIHEVESVAIDPVDPNVIYAGTWHLPWKTTDGGEHWDNMKDGIIDDSDVFSIIVDPVSPKIVYASACSGIYKSENAGLHFEKVQGIPNEARRTRVLMQDPNHRAVVFAGTTEGLFRSEDAGKTWTSKTGTDVVVNDVSIDANNSLRVLIAIDHGGVMASDDGGNTFHPTNGGFSARQITTLKTDLLHPARLYVGVVNDKEWGGVFRSDNGGLNWNQESDGLQGRDVFSLGEAPDGAMIAGTSHGLFRLTADEDVWRRVDGADGSDVVASGPVAVRAVAMPTRPPVPIGRNHFAERKGAPPSAAQKRAVLLKAKRGRGTKTKAGVRSSRSSKTNKASVRKKGTVKAGSKGVVRAKVSGRVVKIQPASGKPAVAPAAPTNPKHGGFDGSVYVLATSNQVILAATSEGLLRSSDDGMTWVTGGPKESVDWRYLAAAKQNVVGASLQSLQFSSDSGANWVTMPLPELLSRVAAIAVEPSGTIWVGGREGVFVSSDSGETWLTPKNLYVNSVSSLYYDEATDRVTLTTGGLDTYNGIVFTVQLPERAVTYANAGWTLRFARPVGDHMVAATLFDGIVVQPKMIASPMAAAESAKR